MGERKHGNVSLGERSSVFAACFTFLLGLMMKNFLTDKDIAERYQVSRCSPWRWAKNGTFPKPIRLSPGVSRWELRQVEEHEQKQAEQAA